MSSPFIYIIGAGGIVNDAHLPAYQLAGYPVAGIYDIDVAKAQATADRFGIPAVFDTLGGLVAAAGSSGIYDIAVPADHLTKLLTVLPAGSLVLMQKPMGMDYAQAKEIVALARSKQLVAAVNFQLRYAPFIEVARALIDAGTIGELCDIEVNVNVHTPWNLWPFLFSSPRVEILYHSIHYIDLIRQLAGNPVGVFAKTVKHPLMQELASVRSSIVLDYGDWLRANILTNHCHVYGLQHQHSFIKLEGTKGAIRIHLGVLMDYPHGQADRLEYVVLQEGVEPVWQSVALEGNWFPHAFMGCMRQLMEVAAGKRERPDNSVEDAIDTMACVEAAYRSDGKQSILLADIL
ncbi:Gfo/Idh/MocA family oxidoreductase [Paraflavitalea sp. CAU 1676]|uniref:Gfo/Idh/MocA family protein n=1 Tax=Paraflavitalea sp. CAU 1676 TaxID=3032598 RepID=UPI0023DBDD15|nr:Gfo/Idh/MocA family oxidoreductase [Paraflavitalea sp. CAU 1676]MDF2190429.1 Gfo/Idh/MocA family oxidoreductase [Paraflavitalea sp. CAU 1676]